MLEHGILALIVGHHRWPLGLLLNLCGWREHDAVLNFQRCATHALIHRGVYWLGMAIAAHWRLLPPFILLSIVLWGQSWRRSKFLIVSFEICSTHVDSSTSQVDNLHDGYQVDRNFLIVIPDKSKTSRLFSCWVFNYLTLLNTSVLCEVISELFFSELVIETPYENLVPNVIISRTSQL